MKRWPEPIMSQRSMHRRNQTPHLSKTVIELIDLFPLLYSNTILHQSEPQPNVPTVFTAMLLIPTAVRICFVISLCRNWFSIQEAQLFAAPLTLTVTK